MTAKIFTDDDLRYGKSVLAKVGLVPPDDHLGILYEAWQIASERYDPLKSNWLTFLGYTLRSVVQEERRYGNLVHVPINQQLSECKHEYVSLDFTVDDSPLHDIIPDTSDEGADSHLLAFLLDEIASMYPSQPKGRQQALKAIQRQIVDGEKPPRKMAQQISVVKREIFDRYKKKYLGITE